MAEDKARGKKQDTGAEAKAAAAPDPGETADEARDAEADAGTSASAADVDDEAAASAAADDPDDDSATSEDSTAGDDAAGDEPDTDDGEPVSVAKPEAAGEPAKAGKKAQAAATKNAKAKAAESDSSAVKETKAGSKKAKVAKAVDAGPGDRKGGLSRAAIAAIAAGVLLLVALNALVFFFLQSRDRQREIDAGKDASAAACDVVRQFVTFDATKDNMDDYGKRLADRWTEDKRQRFRDDVSALKAGMIELKLKSSAREIACGINSVEDDGKKAVVVVSLQQVMSSQQTADQPRRQLSGVTLSMRKVGDSWQVSSLESELLGGR